MTDFFDLQSTEFEELFQAFVLAGGLDTTLVINEAFDRAFMATLCKHYKTFKSCELCYRSPASYFPSGFPQ